MWGFGRNQAQSSSGDSRLKSVESPGAGAPFTCFIFPLSIFGAIMQDPKAREAVTVDFAPIHGSRVGELAARFDIVLGLTPEA